MASYKSAIRSTPTNGQSEPKLKDKAQQLQEFFPSWSHDDLQSLLAEVNGDVELAATRISDGKAEQWGSVSRKKDKKAGHTPKDSISSPPSARGDFRGGRGGARGGRGGSARGGAARARGDFRGGRGGHANGHVSRTSSPAVGQHVDDKAHDEPKNTIDGASEVPPSTSQTPATWTDTAKPEESSTSSAWGGSSAWAQGTADSAGDKHVPHVNINGSAPAAPVQNQPPAPLSAKQISKSPATSKLSWAQIARAQEKPPPPPAPVAQHPPPSASAIHPAVVNEPLISNSIPSTSAPAPAPPEPESITNTGWEDPTTVQNPSFEEELSVPAAAAPEPIIEIEQQPAPETVSVSKEDTSSKPPETVEQAPAPSPAPPTPAPPTPSKVAARPVPISHRNSARYSNYAKIANDQGGVVMPPTPSSISANLSGISSFGSFGDLKSAGVEKVGMQFGSLNLGGTNEPESEPEPAPVAPAVPAEAPPAPVTQAPEPEPISIAPPPSSSLNSGLYQSQSQPIQSSVSQPAVSTTSVTTPANVSPVQSVPSAQPHAQTPSLSQLPQQLQQQAAQTQTLPSHHYAQLGLSTHMDQASQVQTQTQSPPQHVQQAQNYLRQNDQSPYGSAVSASVTGGFNHSSTPPTQDNNGYGAFGSVLSSQSLGSQGLGMTGQALSGLGQGALGGSMGGLGGMSGLGGQGLGHQQQQSLNAFDNYGYESAQRNFYDTYPNAFGRGVLGHDDLKGGLPSQQGQQAPSTTSTGTSTSLPPSASSQSSVPQSQQSPATSVSSTQAQPQPGQGPAPAGYHPGAPVPYYYQPFPHQSSYYGATAMGAPSNYGYGVGGMGVGVPPYPGMNVGKYPTIYPGPPGSAPSPAGKPSPGMGVHGGVIGHGGLGVQPQSYGGGLYGQQQGYDDYQHHTQQQGHQHHNSHGLGLGQDYSKQLYGGQGGLQGYMSGAGGAGSAGVVSGSGAGSRSGASPETAYKPYAPKDVGVGRGNVPQSQAQGQGQSQGQVQGQGGQGSGPQGQGFYGGNRFGGASSVGGVGVPQQNAHGAPLYPQGQNDNGYYYQQRQQQYW
ncbi:hypothetical protein F5878DRAFT_625779 [Lentinula raphanica]|uniref:RNA polymerase II degradation factor 1 n=1 Tax=Lentinula raphanica TaxID=153919 RepID=A0AA38UC56_9AGAR|nr:hypothetical protein F5878DRAFT_625779 [Lentinula raphanica]